MAPAVDHVIYLAHLPAPAELVQGATAQNAKIDRMDQSSDRVVVTYSYANGRSVTFAYTLLSSIGAQEPMALSTSSQPAPMPVQSSATYVAPQPSTVVYTSPPVYYPPAYSSYYDPVWDFWAPVAIGVGLGWGWHGGGWHSGWHGGGWHGGGFRGGFGHGGGHR
ncbi:MAG TPA: hypothetical protein VGM73_08230 [Candidatus Didemnitutus sp.]|jgi:uncharacterized membrane protein YgcG